MAEKMLQFTNKAQAWPDKRSADERALDFQEIYAGFARAKAEEQASRCSQCGVPFCQVHCPLGNHIPDWLKMTAEGRLREAYEISQATNTFPEICGRICPQDRLCEGSCVIEQSGHGTVTIGAIEKYITDTAFEEGWVETRRPARERAQSVGIIGAGPAGLAAADMLRAQGFQVEVYDRYDRVGGLLIYGIPNFKLDKAIVARREKGLRDAGVRFHLNVAVGRDVSFAQLRARHDAILIATGVYKARPLTVPGAGLEGVVAALDYLTAANRQGLGDAVALADAWNAKGRHVVVLGGGDTAVDCVRTAVRQGAASVTCLYRRDRANMPGSAREVSHAEEEGVRFEWMANPRAVTGEGRVAAVRYQKMRMGPPDASGRATPVAADDVLHDIRADMVIAALGFEPEDVPGLFGEPGLAVTAQGTLRVDAATMMTAVEGVYAAGDIVRGASLVVWAIKDGRDAAQSIARALARKETLVAAAE